MPRLFIRFTAFLLIPILVANTSLASTFPEFLGRPISFHHVSKITSRLLTEEAVVQPNSGARYGAPFSIWSTVAVIALVKIGILASAGNDLSLNRQQLAGLTTGNEFLDWVLLIILGSSVFWLRRIFKGSRTSAVPGRAFNGDIEHPLTVGHEPIIPAKLPRRVFQGQRATSWNRSLQALSSNLEMLFRATGATVYRDGIHVRAITKDGIYRVDENADSSPEDAGTLTLTRFNSKTALAYTLVIRKNSISIGYSGGQGSNIGGVVTYSSQGLYGDPRDPRVVFGMNSDGQLVWFTSINLIKAFESDVEQQGKRVNKNQIPVKLEDYKDIDYHRGAIAVNHWNPADRNVMVEQMAFNLLTQGLAVITGKSLLEVARILSIENFPRYFNGIGLRQALEVAIVKLNLTNLNAILVNKKDEHTTRLGIAFDDTGKALVMQEDHDGSWSAYTFDYQRDNSQFDHYWPPKPILVQSVHDIPDNAIVSSSNGPKLDFEPIVAGPGLVAARGETVPRAILILPVALHRLFGTDSNVELQGRTVVAALVNALRANPDGVKNIIDERGELKYNLVDIDADSAQSLKAGDPLPNATRLRLFPRGGGSDAEARNPVVAEPAGYLALAASVKVSGSKIQERRDKVWQIYQDFRKKYPPLAAAQLTLALAIHAGDDFLEWHYTTNSLKELIGHLQPVYGGSMNSSDLAMAILQLTADYQNYRDNNVMSIRGHWLVMVQKFQDIDPSAGLILGWAASFPNANESDVRRVYTALVQDLHYSPKVAALLTVQAMRHKPKEDSSSHSRSYSDDIFGLLGALVDFQATVYESRRPSFLKYGDLKDGHDALVKRGLSAESAALLSIGLPVNPKSEQQDLVAQNMTHFTGRILTENRQTSTTPPSTTLYSSLVPILLSLALYVVAKGAMALQASPKVAILIPIIAGLLAIKYLMPWLMKGAFQQNVKPFREPRIPHEVAAAA